MNSTGATITRTTPKRAFELVGRGTHRVRGRAIEAIESDHRVSSDGCIPRKQRHFDNGNGFASIGAIKGLPCTGDVIKLLMGRRPTESPRDQQTIEISRRVL